MLEKIIQTFTTTTYERSKQDILMNSQVKSTAKYLPLNLTNSLEKF